LRRHAGSQILRLGGGEFYQYAEEIVDNLRLLFLDEVARIEPDVLHSLAYGPYEACKKPARPSTGDAPRPSAPPENPLFKALSTARQTGIPWQLAKGSLENWLLNPEPLSSEHPVVKQLEVLLRGWLDDPVAAILYVLRNLSDSLATRMTLGSQVHSRLDEWAARWNLCVANC
jgi:hypothetical protein